MPRFHKITYGIDAVLPAYPGDTSRIPFTSAEEAAADADEAAAIERQAIAADRAAELHVLHAKLAASEDLTQVELNRMLALERQS